MNNLSNMDTLIKDIIIKICAILRTHDKLNFLSVTKKNCEHKYGIFFDEKICLEKIFTLPYFDNFTNIKILHSTFLFSKQKFQLRLNTYNKSRPNKMPVNLVNFLYQHYYISGPLDTAHAKQIRQNVKACIPKNATHLHLEDAAYLYGYAPKQITHLILGFINDEHVNILRRVKYLNFKYIVGSNTKIPYGITHLIFSQQFCKDIVIPTSVTHLTLNSICCSMLGQIIIHIPDSVKYLDTVWEVAEVPNNITHLVYRANSYHINKRWIPPSVTHLELFNEVYHSDLVPSTVTHLTLSNYESCPRKKIPANVEHVTYKYAGDLCYDSSLDWNCVPHWDSDKF